MRCDPARRWCMSFGYNKHMPSLQSNPRGSKYRCVIEGQERQGNLKYLFCSTGLISLFTPSKFVKWHSARTLNTPRLKFLSHQKGRDATSIQRPRGPVAHTLFHWQERDWPTILRGCKRARGQAWSASGCLPFPENRLEVWWISEAVLRRSSSSSLGVGTVGWRLRVVTSRRYGDGPVLRVPV